MESCGQFHSGDTEIAYDGEAEYPNDDETETGGSEKASVKKRRAKVLGIGPDGRKIYTRDADARAGHRTATNTRPTKLYVGRELHLGVAVSALDHTDRVSYANLGRPVPQVVVTSSLVPAGTHRAKAVVDGIIEAHQSNLCSEVLVDGGYSLSKPEYFHQRLHQAGIDQTIRILTHQRGPHGSIGDAVLVDGQPFSGHLPAGEHQLDMPGRNADDATRRACVEKFNERAKLRYTVHTRKADGTVRYKCPFCVGRAHSPKFPKTMKSRNKKSRLVQPGKTAKTCCNGIVTADTDATFLDQKAIFRDHRLVEGLGGVATSSSQPTPPSTASTSTSAATTPGSTRPPRSRCSSPTPSPWSTRRGPRSRSASAPCSMTSPSHAQGPSNTEGSPSGTTRWSGHGWPGRDSRPSATRNRWSTT